MHLRALTLIPQRLPCHVVAYAQANITGLLSTRSQIRNPVPRCIKSSLSKGCRFISSNANANAARPNVLKEIGDHTRSNLVSIFHSRSDNPYHNLAIENHILKHSHPESEILLFYTNRPCVVFGRNQNPWLECNIARIQEGLPKDVPSFTACGKNQDAGKQVRTEITEPIDLVRRRSGGGTVVHDEGNLNFSFIVPHDREFRRDKHGWHIVDSLLGPKIKDDFAGVAMYDSVRPNERNDIVMVRKGDATRKEFKVSGSAFKLTRGRALHHGTILHSSPNVHRRIPVSQDEGAVVSASVFSALLSSPAEPYLEAKGSRSVRSPIHNLFDVQNQQQRHKLMTVLREHIWLYFTQAWDERDGIPVIEVGDEDCLEEINQDVYQDVQEIMADDWRYCQTPTFEYRSGEAAGDLNMQFQVKHGTIKDASLSCRGNLSGQHGLEFSRLEGRKLHEIRSWEEYLPSSQKVESGKALAHLNMVFPRINLAHIDHERRTDHGTIKETSSEDNNASSLVSRQLENGNVEVEERDENTVVEHQPRARR